MCCEWLRQPSETMLSYMQAVKAVGAESVDLGGCGQADVTCQFRLSVDACFKKQGQEREILDMHAMS